MPEKSVMPVGREALPSRRTVVRTAAWTLPAVTALSAAPAFACTPGQLALYRVSATGLTSTGSQRTGDTAWNSANGRFNRRWEQTFTPVFVPQAGTSPSETSQSVTLSATASRANTSNSLHILGDTFTQLNNAGNTGRSGLLMEQTRGSIPSNLAASQAGALVYTFTFSRPVTNLSFTVTDLDWSTNQSTYSDRVEVGPAGFTHVFPTGANAQQESRVQGAGTAAEPFRPGGTATSQTGGTGAYSSQLLHDQSSSRGNVNISFNSTPVTTFQLRYWNNNRNGNSASGLQRIWLTNLAFEYETC